jgi:hypothetical protein
VKNNSQGVAMAAADAADAMAQIHAIHASGSLHRAMVDSKYHGITLAQGHYLGA